MGVQTQRLLMVAVHRRPRVETRYAVALSLMTGGEWAAVNVCVKGRRVVVFLLVGRVFNVSTEALILGGVNGSILEHPYTRWKY